MQIIVRATQRLAASIPTLLLVLISLFLLVQFAPGDAVDALTAQIGGGGNTAMMDELRTRYGLDLSLVEQLLQYLWRLATFDLGYSIIYGQPVAQVILDRLLVTFLLMSAALAISFFVGAALGILAATRVGKWQDLFLSTLALVLYSTPTFWLGLMLIVVFSVTLSWLPSGGLEQIGSGFTGIRRAADIAAHLVLPSVCLSFFYLATYMRIMRASILEVMTMDFVRTARAKGLSERKALISHTLRNALLPMVTLFGLQAATVLGGSVVTETVFQLPGLGRLAYEAVVQRDLNTLLGVVFVSALMVIAINFLVDLVYAWIDPRIVFE